VRTTDDFERLQLWRKLYDPAVVTVERIVAVRGESIFRDRGGYFGLDLTFRGDDDTFVVVPAIVVDTFALARRSRRAFVWPRSVAAVVNETAAGAIEDLVLPWLRSLFRGRALAGEYRRMYGPSPVFETARERGFLGAAPYGASLIAIAPVLYAQRFGRRDAARAVGSDSGLWAAGLRMQATIVEHDADEAARAWFALAPSQATTAPAIGIASNADAVADARFALAMNATTGAGWRTIDVPRPVALDVYTTFDRADAPVVTTFAVRGADGPERVPNRMPRRPSVGGSAGVVRVALRDDAWAARDVDTDEATELTARLAGEGIDAQAISYSRSTTEACDLVHYYATYDDPAFLSAAESRRASGGSYAVTLAPQTGWTGWAEEGHFLLGQLAHDDGRERLYRSAFEGGHLQMEGVANHEDPAERAAREARFAAVVAGASAIFLAPGEDVEAFHERYPAARPGTVSTLGPFIADEPASAAIGALVGDEPFALLHGSTINRNRQLPVVTALARANIPCVLAGPLADVYLGVTVRRYGGPRTVYLTDPTAGELAALYRRATLFVDGSPRPLGYARIVRATLCGALPVVPSDSPALRVFAGAAATFEALSLASAMETLQAAFASDDAQRLRVLRAQAAVARYGDGDGAFATLVAAYAGL
jgi:hypothetical protein